VLYGGTTYAMPKGVSTTFGVDCWQPKSYFTSQWRPLSSLREPTLTILAMDYYRDPPVADWGIDGWLVKKGFTDDTNRRPVRHDRTGNANATWNADAKGVDNFLFADGHVDPLPNKAENAGGKYPHFFKNR